MRFCLHAALFCITISAAQAAPDETVLRAQEGADALRRGKFEQAIAIYDTAVQDQNLPPARMASFYNDRGVAKWRLEKFDEAIADLTKAIEIYPQYASLYNNRGNVLLSLEKPEDALKDFDKAIELSPGYGAAYNNRANANHELGRHEAAIEDYKQAIQAMPANAVPFNGRGKSQGVLGRPYTALRYLTRALTLNGKYPAAYRNRAVVYLHLERFQDAIADFDKVIALAPEDAELYLGRGRAYMKTARGQNALRDFSKAIELDPENAEALAERGAMNVERRQYDLALEDLNQALSIDGELAAARFHRAQALFRTGDDPGALEEVGRALALDARYAEAVNLRAEIAEKQGAIDAALADYRRAVEFDPFLQTAKDAVKRLGGEEAGLTQAAAPVSGWEIISPAPGRYVALNARFPKIKILLEMHGAGAPAILEWTPFEKTLNGIGLLRYDAGLSAGEKKNEYIVILDTARGQIVSIEPWLSGEAKAKWDWTDNAVTITDTEGVVGFYELRKPRAAPRYADDRPWGGYNEWGEPPRNRRRQQGPNPFKWLFGF